MKAPLGSNPLDGAGASTRRAGGRRSGVVPSDAGRLSRNIRDIAGQHPARHADERAGKNAGMRSRATADVTLRRASKDLSAFSVFFVAAFLGPELFQQT